MKGAQYILVALVVILACALYLMSSSGVSHLEALPGATPAGSPHPPADAQLPVFIAPTMPHPAIAPAPAVIQFAAAPVPGVGYLTTPVEVPTQYGKVTFQPGTRLQIQDRDGNMLDVLAGGTEFAIDASLVSGNKGAAPLPAGPPHTLQSTSPFAPGH
jgi:hypothetical protein